MIKTLGRGSFGKVKLCLNTMDGALYAIKVGPRVGFVATFVVFNYGVIGLDA